MHRTEQNINSYTAHSSFLVSLHRTTAINSYNYWRCYKAVLFL